MASLPAGARRIIASERWVGDGRLGNPRSVVSCGIGSLRGLVRRWCGMLLIMRRRAGLIVLAMLVAVAVPGCGSGAEEELDTLRVPLGRSAVVPEDHYVVMVDGVGVEPAVVADGYGGYWARIHYDPDTNTEVTVRFVTSGVASPVDSTSVDHDWLAPSPCIDSADAQLVEEARRVTTSCEGTVDKARALQRFVADRLEYRVYRDHVTDAASRTYELGYGTCINHARLFVALSRAAGVPARTVRGIVYDDGVFDAHHEWAEVCDEEGRWHQLDPVSHEVFDIASGQYLDLIYAAEENPFNPDDVDPTALAATEWIAYDTSLEPYDGRLGFRLVDSEPPDRFVLENTYVLPRGCRRPQPQE